MVVEGGQMSRGESTLVDGRRAAVEQFRLGVLLEERGDPASAELAYRQADALNHAGAALNLGILHEARGDLRAAKASYRRAHKRGDENGAFNLGALLEDRGDLAGAKRAYKLADSAGHAPAAGRLAAILAAGGDVDGARAARRRAQERLARARRSAEPRAGATGAPRWAARRRAVLARTTSAAVGVGKLVARSLPNTAPTSPTLPAAALTHVSSPVTPTHSTPPPPHPSGGGSGSAVASGGGPPSSGS
jgi:tetratricopeptide (TPR) repeat protein